jgi:hypothetical protein
MPAQDGPGAGHLGNGLGRLSGCRRLDMSSCLSFSRQWWPTCGLVLKAGDTVVTKWPQCVFS